MLVFAKHDECRKTSRRAKARSRASAWASAVSALSRPSRRSALWATTSDGSGASWSSVRWVPAVWLILWCAWFFNNLNYEPNFFPVADWVSSCFVIIGALCAWRVQKGNFVWFPRREVGACCLRDRHQAKIPRALPPSFLSWLFYTNFDFFIRRNWRSQCSLRRSFCRVNKRSFWAGSIRVA